MYTGLIQLMLPHAKIIDIWREPMPAGFALFKMNCVRGVDNSYDQRDIARYYRAYAYLMAHTEDEIRRLLAYSRLPFEEGYLHYLETERAVQAPSSEKVRQPIYKGSVDVLTHYHDWLEPMRKAFGDLV